MKPSFAIVGCGKVGTALGIFLSKAGYPLAGVASKSLSSATRTAKILKTEQFSTTPWDITPKADIVFITTPDGVIAEACESIAHKHGFREAGVVLHCSGALPSTLLAPAKACGAVIGSLHPLQSFASIPEKGASNPFGDIIAAVEGEPQALEVARQAAIDLGAVCYTIRTDAKTLYHAAAVVASNYLVGLLDLAFKLIEEAGIAREDAFNVLRPLIDGTLANINNIGIPAALTGPIARGDVNTVEQHVTAIGEKAPDLSALYKQLGDYTIDIACAKGGLTDNAAEKLKRLLSN